MTTLLLRNGTILTADPQRPSADWLLLRGDRVEDLGSGRAPAIGDTPVLDLAGRTVVPGFFDAHVHLTWIALGLMGPDLASTTGVDDVLQAMAEWTGPGRGPERAWVVGDGFDETTWKDRRLPTREELDSLGGDRPRLIKRVCGHVSVGNSLALAAVPDGPHTDRASGRIAENDLWALSDRLRPDQSALHETWPRVQERLHEFGITSVHDVASLQLVEALEAFDRQDALEVRVSYSVPAAHRADLEGWTRATDASQRLRFLGLKVWTDGSLGAHTAFLRQVYADAPETRGTPLYEQNALRAVFRDAHEQGWQLMVHAIGDAALDEVLGEIQPLCRDGNPLQHRLEHIEVTPPEIVARLGQSGAWGCVQPNFARRWSQPDGMNEQRLGRDRLQHCNAYRSLLQAGMPLAFGSDCMPLGPIYGMLGAVHHPIATERLTPEEALHHYCARPATMCFGQEGDGMLRRGSTADLAVLEGDPFAEEGDARCVATMLAGRFVWQDRESVAGPREPC